MISGVFEGAVALFLAIVGAIYIAGQVRANATRNQADINDIKGMIKEYQECTQTLIEKNMEDMKDLLDTNKEHQADALSREVSHLKDLISFTNNETRADIQRLQNEQRESNNLKAKILLMQSSLKALHHRLDIEPPVIIEEE